MISKMRFPAPSPRPSQPSNAPNSTPFTWGFPVSNFQGDGRGCPRPPCPESWLPLSTSPQLLDNFGMNIFVSTLVCRFENRQFFPPLAIYWSIQVVGGHLTSSNTKICCWWDIFDFHLLHKVRALRSFRVKMYVKAVPNWELESADSVQLKPRSRRIYLFRTQAEDGSGAGLVIPPSCSSISVPLLSREPRSGKICHVFN
jgi:hypothetical protein